MCKKQISVSHSSTEAEVISLDAGFRMDGIPALDLWDLVIEVFHSSPNQTNNTRDDRESRGNLSAKTQPNMRKQIPTMHTNLDLTDIDHVPSSVTHSGCSAMLYVFEDNETMIKMIIKGWSPTVRHVSRTHRVALNWLFDRINLDSKIQNRYIDTKHQLTDSLTKGNFTRDEWDNLLHLFNISHFSSTCCSLNFSLTSCPEKIAKRMWEQKGEERSVAKSKMNLSSHVPASSSTAKIPIASESPGILTATGKGWEEIRTPTQRRVLKWSCKMHTLAGWWTKQRWNLSQQKKNQVMWIFPYLKLGAFMKRKWLGDRLLTNSYRETWSIQQIRKVGKPKSWKKRMATRRQSSRSSKKTTNESPRTQWRIWTWTRLFGAYSWIPLFKHQFILVKSTRWIYDSSRIISGSLWLEQLSQWN